MFAGSDHMCIVLVSYVHGGRLVSLFCFFLMIRRPPRSTLDRSSAASDVYKRQAPELGMLPPGGLVGGFVGGGGSVGGILASSARYLSLIHISEPTRPY